MPGGSDYSLQCLTSQNYKRFLKYQIKWQKKLTSLLQNLRAAISHALISLNLQFRPKRVAYPCQHIEPRAVSIILDAAKV